MPYKNLDDDIAYHKAYYQANREHLLEYQRLYRLSHLNHEYEREYQRLYYHANKARILEQRRLRRSKERTIDHDSKPDS